MSIGRRQFVSWTVGGLAAAACASLVTTPVRPVDGAVRLVLTDWPELTRPGGSARLRVDGTDRQIWVLARDDGTFAAVSPICKHQGCIVEIAADRLACPCHGSQYDREGNVLRGPTRAPLDRFETQRTADNILVIAIGA